MMSEWVPAAVVVAFCAVIATMCWSLGVRDRIISIILSYFVKFDHHDGHVMPSAPFRRKGYFSEANFFGPELSKIYGRVYYVWHGFKPVVILSDVEAIRSFYKDHFSHARDPDYTCCGEALEGVMGEAIGVTHGRDKIKEHRGQFDPHFSNKAVTTLHPIIGEVVDTWIESLPVGESLDLLDAGLTDVPLYTITCATYGQNVMRTQMPEVRRLVKLFNKALGSSRNYFGQITSLVHKYFRDWPIPEVEKFNIEWEMFHQRLVENREKKECAENDGFFLLIYDRIKAGLTDLTYKQLLHTTDEILLFNVDITYAAASFVIYDISKYPEVQERLIKELDRALSEVDPGQCGDLEAKLPYLHMVVKESARMHPALGATFPELTVKDVTDLAGYQVPKGTIVCIDPHSLNYDPAYWPNPDKFCPERFAAGQHHTPYSFFRFGLGPRKCMGYRLAQAMNVIIVTKLLQKFQFELADPTAKEKIKTEGTPFFTPYLPPNVVFKQRVK